MILKKFNPDIHSSFKLAELMYSVDEKTYLKLFKSKKIAISSLKKLIKAENKENINIDSNTQYETIYVLVNDEKENINRNIDENKDKHNTEFIIKNNSKSKKETSQKNHLKENIIGLMILIKEEKISFLKSTRFLLKNLKLNYAMKFIFIEILDYLTLSKINKNDLYIAELAIARKHQGKGLGKYLVSSAIKIAKKEGFNRLVIDADFNNIPAKKLYESMGFKIFNKRSIKICKKVRGMYNMEFILK